MFDGLEALSDARLTKARVALREFKIWVEVNAIAYLCLNIC